MEFQNKLQEVFKENDITVIDFTNEKSKIVFKCNSCGEQYVQSCARNLLSRITLCKKCYNPFNRWNKERLEEYKIKRLYPQSEIEIIEFKSLRKGGIIKCKKCGTIETINNFEALFAARKGFCCMNCEKDLNKTYNHLMSEISKGFVSLLEWNGVNEKSKFQCNRCGHIFFKNVTKNFDGKKCPNCFKVSNKFDFKDGEKLLQNKAGQDYKLLQFTGTKNRSLIQHKCGFCYSTRIETFEKTKGCPKCYKTYSSLEQAVAKFLDKNGYQYTRQKRFQNLPRFSFDFEVYLPTRTVLIEVQGQQHYKNIDYFKDGLEKQQKRDSIKREYCLINNIPLIEIPYYEIKNISYFLSLKFNDYLEREQGSSESEVI